MTRETIYNVLTAVLIGLALCAFVLHGLDALFL
jgi:multisubunit Na+/H+ antiporter MnhC subunit